MKTLMAMILACLFSANIYAQTKLTETQQEQIIAKIDKAASKMTSLQCEFTQTKTMKMLSKNMESEGVMYFKRMNKLRWEFKSPYTYTFVMNGDKVSMKSSKSAQNIDVKRNKIFRQITDIIINCITGEGLKNDNYFQLEMYESNNQYFARLYPKKKELKQIYKSVELHFNPELTMVSSVKMEEKTGDVTLIKMNNTKMNVPINENLFVVN